MLLSMAGTDVTGPGMRSCAVGVLACLLANTLSTRQFSQRFNYHERLESLKFGCLRVLMHSSSVLTRIQTIQKRTITLSQLALYKLRWLSAL